MACCRAWRPPIQGGPPWLDFPARPLVAGGVTGTDDAVRITTDPRCRTECGRCRDQDRVSPVGGKYHPDVSKEAGAEDRFKAVNGLTRRCATGETGRLRSVARARYRPGDVQPPPGGPGGPGFDFEEVFAVAAQAAVSAILRRPVPSWRRQQSRAPPGDTRAKLAVSQNIHRATACASASAARPSRCACRVSVPAGDPVGETGQRGGDLLLEIEYAAHPRFEVDGRNIIYTLPSAVEAALGRRSRPTLGGDVELKVPKDSEAAASCACVAVACRQERVRRAGRPDRRA